MVEPLASPHRTSQNNYEAVASIARELSLFEALMCFFTIATECNEPPEGVNSHSDDDRYDIVGYGGAAGQPTRDLSDQLRGCSIDCTRAILV